MSHGRSRNPADFERLLKLVLFTDIVNSTAFAIKYGDDAWHDVLNAFYHLAGDHEGPAIHIAARILEQAQAGELLTSGTVRDLVLGSSIPFQDRGFHRLRGIPEEQHLYAIAA